MSAPDVLLHMIGQALVDTLDVSVMSDVVIEATPEFAESIWRAWDARADYAQKCRELEALTRTGEEELEEVVDGVVRKLGLSTRSEQTESIFSYLGMLPATIRRHFRRPANPLGTALPVGLPLYGSWDLMPLLPARMPKFQPGDRPWGIGDWELRELIGLGASGEVWKAVNPRLHDRPPVALHFFTSQAARRTIRERAAAALDRVVVQGRLPGVVPIQQMHLLADPPCVQFAYLQAPDLASLVQQWRETNASIDPLEVADLIHQVAHTLGRLHELKPAIVHGNLCGSTILLMTDAENRRRCLVANLGLGHCSIEANAQSDGSRPDLLLAAPADARAELTAPHGDVYALGVLWYQLLVGDLTRPRPGGSSWRRRLATRGMPASLIELLESCFDDEPSARPATGAVLAAAIGPSLSHRR